MTMLTVDQIASAAGIQPERVKRVIREFSSPTWADCPRPAWHGATLVIDHSTGGPFVQFASLPDHIREAVVLRDQRQLPLAEPKD